MDLKVLQFQFFLFHGSVFWVTANVGKFHKNEQELPVGILALFVLTRMTPDYSLTSAYVQPRITGGQKRKTAEAV